MVSGRGWRVWGALGALIVVAAGCGGATAGQDAGGDAVGEVQAEVVDASEAAGEALDAAADADLRPTGPWEVPSGPEDRTFHAGPWLGATTTTSVAVSWQTDAPGDAFFVALDNTLDGGDFFFPLGAKDPPLWTWLQAQVASEACQAARWRFAFFHYPPQSACQETWMHMQATRDVVLPLLQAHGFQAVFTGHTHEYEHQVYDRVHVFITGGGGGGLDTDEDCTFDLPELVFRRSLHHHLTVDLDDEHATLRAVSIEGEEFDRVVILPDGNVPTE